MENKRSGKNQFKSISMKDVIEKAKTKGLSVIKGQNYINTKTKIIFKDKYGFRFSLSYDSLKSKSKPNILLKNPFALENLKTFIYVNGLEYQILEEVYVDCKKPIKCLCGCGNIFYITADKIINRKQKGCNKCRGYYISESKYLSEVILKKRIEELGYKLIDQYIKGVCSYIDVEDADGYRYHTTLHRLTPSDICKNRIFMNNKWLGYNIKNYILVHNIGTQLVNIENQKGIETVLHLKCICGSEYNCTLKQFLYYGHTRCIKCKSHMSNLERKVQQYFEQNNIEYIFQYRIKECKNINTLPFDFAVFKNNELFCLIEVQGIQHYEPILFHSVNEIDKNEYGMLKLKERQNHDMIKETFCNQNNILLIKLKYTSFENNEYMQILDSYGVANHR